MKIISNKAKQNSIKPLVFAITCALSGNAFAFQEQTQEPDKNDNVGVERISVTAQKRVTPLQETPIAISAFNSETIEKLGIEDVSDLNNLAPNTLVVAPIGSAYNVGINIRGIGTASPSLAIDPKVGIYVDGVYYARNVGAILSIVDLERVEVLRGPQGTLWGKNTTGGAISMVTKGPADEFGFSQRFSVGNFGLKSSLTSVDTGENSGFSARFTYLKSEEDGWATNVFAGAKEKDLGAKETDAFRIALQYETDKLKVNYTHDNTDGSAVSIPVQVSNVRPYFTDPTVPTMHMGTGVFYGGNVFAQMAENEFTGGRQEVFSLDQHGREYVKISGHALNIEWDFSDNHRLKSITSSRKYSSDIPDGADFDGGAYFGVELDATFQPTGNFGPIPAFHSYNQKSQEQTSQEFQLLGNFMDGRLEYVAGYFYFSEEGQENNPWEIGIFTGQGANLLFDDPLAWGGFYKSTSDATALFAQVNYDVNDKLNLSVGIRNTKDEKSITQLAAPDPMLRNDKSAKEDWSKTVGSIVANYVKDENTTFYASISQGYAAGVYNPGTVDRFAYLNPANMGEAIYDGSLIPGNPEDTTAYEIGAKMFMLDDRLMLNTAVFLNDNTNLLVTVFDGTIQRALNSGESETIGYEIDAQFAVTSDLSLSATYGYRDTEYSLEEFTDVNTFSATFGLDWNVADFEFGSMNLNINYVMNDDNQFNNNDPTLVGEAYNLLNARLTLSDINVGERSNLKVSLWGRNITDEVYTLHGANFSFYDTHVYGTPASFGLDVSFTY
ncbi:MAG: TonB-dependent receptor [Glaciecola sp.]|nr:TonB-dependent receptor [Glaciecola sp.]